MNQIQRFISRLWGRGDGRYPRVLSPRFKKTRGRVLFSYVSEGVVQPDYARYFRGHTNKWESREIAHIFARMGYEVDAIDWNDTTFTPTQKYDVIFDICSNLQRLAPHLPANAKKLLHLTGSDAHYQNTAENNRVQAMNRRRECLYAPKRLVADPEAARRSLLLADACSLLGNGHTLTTFPSEYRNKISLVPVSASLVSQSRKQNEYVPKAKEFLWFFGFGAVHKGLDLVLEVFAKNPRFVLNVIGNVTSEQDFLEVYRRELFETPNIQFHGFLNPDSAEFRNVTKRCFCFIAPTCSEGTSTAVVTCLQVGLFPIVSRDTGVQLPESRGIMLDDCEINTIATAVHTAHAMQNGRLAEAIKSNQKDAVRKHSRKAFSVGMQRFISQALSQ